MRALGGLLRVLPALALGAVVGLASVWVHRTGWGLPLGWGATLAAAAAVPAGLRRMLYAAAWIVTASCFVLTRPEGDLVVESDAAGYAVLGLGLVVAAVAVATIPARAGRGGTGGPAA